MIGNGWTIDIITHILKNIKEKIYLERSYQMTLFWGDCELKLKSYKKSLSKLLKKPIMQKNRDDIRNEIIKERIEFGFNCEDKELIEYFTNERYDSQKYLINYYNTEVRQLKEWISRLEKHILINQNKK